DFFENSEKNEKKNEKNEKNEKFLEKFCPNFDKKNLAFIYSYGRSGSTLFGRLFYASSPNLTCFSEPEILNILFQIRSRNEISEIFEVRLLKIFINLMCRPFAENSFSSSSFSSPSASSPSPSSSPSLNAPSAQPHFFVIKPKFLALSYSKK